MPFAAYYWLDSSFLEVTGTSSAIVQAFNRSFLLSLAVQALVALLLMYLMIAYD